ncbi:hypothetical protein KPH14_012673 [Odynerus spinipes]|uniref:DUF7041 domain-containing protein n=1 Tax=Odynerus spinipes TaxID=1348599 RepID=A0AAD9R8T9_9HYME|nr:hypothetical protein KPH14_012673 [Odynerus spinipes]
MEKNVAMPGPSKACENESENKTEIQASEFRSVKLPTFWREEPKLWFAILEKEFAAYGVRSDAVKSAAVLRHLDSSTMKIIADVIASPTASESYTQIRNTLISRLATSEEAQLRQLLTGIELNDRKPSELLREMKFLAGDKVSANVLQTLWLQRLPTRVQELLAVVEDVPTDKLATLADKTVERTNSHLVASITESKSPPKAQNELPQLLVEGSEIAELTRRIAQLETIVRSQRTGRLQYRGRSKSRDRSRSRGGSLCYYHKRFRTESRKCKKPCSWQGPDKRQQEN